ncbi:MAG: hypothetical protein AABY11_04075, partial [archaeon]
MRGIEIFLLGMVFVLAGCLEPAPSVVEEVHLHADFSLVLDGVPFNLAHEKYMTSDKNNRSALVHLHDLDGNVVHVHAPGITIGDFLESIGLSLKTTNNAITLTLDDGTVYETPHFGCHEVSDGQTICVDPAPDSKTIEVYVNGNEIEENENYLFKDLDRVLVIYRSLNAEVGPFLEAVT